MPPGRMTPQTRRRLSTFALPGLVWSAPYVGRISHQPSSRLTRCDDYFGARVIVGWQL
jgi:hypothetical protein